MQEHTENKLYKYIEVEVEEAKAALSQNNSNTPEAIEKLKAQLDSLWSSIKTQGFAEDTGNYEDFMPRYAIMQGIIEKSQIQALKEIELSQVEISVTTPGIYPPLTLANGQNLAEIDLNNFAAFDLYRKPILDQFLEAGAKMNVTYCHNAESALADKDADGLRNYAANVEKYGIMEFPILRIDMNAFPNDLVQTWYQATHMSPISVEANYADNKSNEWAIRFGRDDLFYSMELSRFL